MGNLPGDYSTETVSKHSLFQSLKLNQQETTWEIFYRFAFFKEYK